MVRRRWFWRQCCDRLRATEEQQNQAGELDLQIHGRRRAMACSRIVQEHLAVSTWHLAVSTWRLALAVSSQQLAVRETLIESSAAKAAHSKGRSYGRPEGHPFQSEHLIRVSLALSLPALNGRSLAKCQMPSANC